MISKMNSINDDEFINIKEKFRDDGLEFNSKYINRQVGNVRRRIFCALI